MKIRRENYALESFQWDFYTALNRFPSMIAGWGTGKTMAALFKGDLLNRFYKNNLGLIVRNKFTDLRDSTMKDFTRYTGKTVPQGTKEAHYANGSVTLFRHAKELTGLQNVNLGWVYIEQAEEFPTDTQFQLLRGRLRRELEVDDEYWQVLLKTGAVHDFLQSMHDKPLRQIMTICNAKGHNWCWKMFIKSPMERYSCIQANSFDNKDNLPQDFIEDLARMKADSPARFAQYVMNSHDEVDLDACYYASKLSDLRKQKHITNISYDPSERVHLAADVGLDCTAIWFFQIIGKSKHFIDYYENTGKFADHYSRILEEKKKNNGYIYGKFIQPHDTNKREMVSKTTFSKFFRDLGYDVISLPREVNVDFGINNVNNMLSSCWFDENKCELGLEALQHYRREYNEELKAYLKKPLHDWASHPADSMRYACKGISKGLFSMVTSISTDQIKKWTEKHRRVG